MPKIVQHLQRSPEWLAWRRGKVTASMCATVMGFNPHESPLMLYERLQSGKEVEVNPAMARGIMLEPIARKWAEDQLGFEYPESCAEDDEYPWMAASLDGYNPNAKVKAIEIKCMGEKGSQEAKLGVVNSLYFPQLQMQMRVYGLSEMYYVAFYGTDGDIIKVKRDDAFIEKMVPALKAFRSSLIDFIPPEPTDMDLTVLDDPASNEAVKIIEQANMIIKQQENMIEEAKALLKKHSDGRSCRVGDHRFVKYFRKGAIEYGKIEVLKEIDLELYRKPKTESWRFT